jgi:hypothetical protein
VDDIVIMSEKETDHIADLTETFDNMRRNGLKFNPEGVTGRIASLN